MNSVGIGNVIRPEFISGGACALLASAMVLAASASSRAEPPKLPVPAIDQSAVAQRGHFYVGGKYTGELGKDIMQGQVYVEVLAPKDVRRPYPLAVLGEGASMSSQGRRHNSGRGPPLP